MTSERGAQTGIILQARMGSTRLPGKVLMPLGGTTILGWIVQRLAVLPWPVIVATSDMPRDDVIADTCARMATECFRGSEQDVLDRYYHCARAYGFAHVIRLTGDNPFPDAEALRQLVALHHAENADYTHSFGKLPVGVGGEIISFQALELSWQEGRAAHHREHVNEYILENPRRFRIEQLDVASSKQAPQLSLTIDTPADYQRIASCLGPADVNISTEELIRKCSYSV